MSKSNRFRHYFSKFKSKMSDYYNNLINQYQARFAPQKTPQQIAEEQKIQAYQTYIGTKEGAEALNEVQIKFTAWYDENFGIKKSGTSTEVLELKEMVSQMAKQNELMAKQMETLTNQLK